MRYLVVCLLLLSGCLGADDAESAILDDSLVVDTWTILFSSPLVFQQDTPPLTNSVAFEVGEGTVQLVADPEWTCISMCRLHIWLESPAGIVVENERGGQGAAFIVDEPPGGQWTFKWLASQEAAVGIDGRLHLTTAS